MGNTVGKYILGILLSLGILFSVSYNVNAAVNVMNPTVFLICTDKAQAVTLFEKIKTGNIVPSDYSECRPVIPNVPLNSLSNLKLVKGPSFDFQDDIVGVYKLKDQEMYLFIVLPGGINGDDV